MSDPDRTVFMPRTGLAPGVRLNGIYEIERLIATGGMGEVYQGRAIQTGDAVAIKIVRSDMAQDANVLTLFRNEAAALFPGLEGVPTCVTACQTAVDCDMGLGGAYDADNYDCVDGGCVWIGCHTSRECGVDRVCA